MPIGCSRSPGISARLCWRSDWCVPGRRALSSLSLRRAFPTCYVQPLLGGGGPRGRCRQNSDVVALHDRASGQQPTKTSTGGRRRPVSAGAARHRHNSDVVALHHPGSRPRNPGPATARIPTLLPSTTPIRGNNPRKPTGGLSRRHLQHPHHRSAASRTSSRSANRRNPANGCFIRWFPAKTSELRARKSQYPLVNGHARSPVRAPGENAHSPQ